MIPIPSAVTYFIGLPTLAEDKTISGDAIFTLPPEGWAE
jgi:hypothetical protein